MAQILAILNLISLIMNKQCYLSENTPNAPTSKTCYYLAMNSVIWKRLGNTLFAIVVIGSLSFIIYVNRAKYVPVYEDLAIYIGLNEPCSKPIIYYIDQFDTRFGQSQTEFESNLNQAITIWNRAYGQELFKYSKTEAEEMSDLSRRKLAINLIYDQSQETTEKLKVIDANIDNSKSTYEGLKTRFDNTKATYEARKKALEDAIAVYEKNKLAYENQVDYLNSQKGATKQQYNELERQRIALNNEVQRINTANKELNITVNELNSLVGTLNSMNKDINQKINTFNNVSLTNGPEFQEGEYVLDENGQRINIYEFKDQSKLVRVLAHEFGHALGIDHVEDEKSIMHAYNNSSNLIPTKNDLMALETICKRK